MARPSSATPRRVALAAMAMPLLIAGCGTTLPHDGAALNTGASDASIDSGAQAGAAGGGSVVSGGTTALGGASGVQQGSAGGPTAGGGSGGGLAAPGAGSGTNTSTGGAGGTATQSGGSSGAVRGVTAKTVTLGVYASRTLNAAASAFGDNSGSFPDPSNQYAALAKYINSTGGLGGKKVSIYIHWRDDSNAASDFSAADQAACTDFTQDHAVFAVLSVYGGHGLAPCLSQAGIPLIESGGGPPGFGAGQWDQTKGYYITPNQISDLRFMGAYGESIGNANWVKPGDRVGLVYEGFPQMQNAVSKGLLPALARHGIKIADTEVFSVLQRPTDYSQTEAQAQSAAFKFKGEQINKVITIDQQNTTFIDAARQQNYYPHYAVTTLGQPNGTAAYEGTQSGQQVLTGSIGVGFSAGQDLSPDDAAKTLSSSAKTCLDIMHKAGLNTTINTSNGTAVLIMLWNCEGFFFLKKAISLAPALTPAGYVAGALSVGRSLTPVTTMGMDVGPGHYDGVSAVRPLTFVASCTCYRYTGSAVAVP